MFCVSTVDSTAIRVDRVTLARDVSTRDVSRAPIYGTDRADDGIGKGVEIGALARHCVL